MYSRPVANVTRAMCKVIILSAVCGGDWTKLCTYNMWHLLVNMINNHNEIVCTSKIRNTTYVINFDKIGENFKSIHQMTEIKHDYLFLIDFTI